jgi:Tol biopolymer transport system component
MRRFPTRSLLVLLSACKAQISGVPLDAVAPPADAPAIVTDASNPVADAPELPLGAWQPPVKIDVASTGGAEDDVTLSSNTLELFFAIANGGNGKDLFYTSRATTTSPWATPLALPFNVAMQSDETPRLSADDLTLYFASGRGNGSLDIFQVTRDAPGSLSWSTPVPVQEVNTTLDEKWFMPCGTNHYVLVRDAGQNGTNLFEGDLGGAAPVAITTLNEPTNQSSNETGTLVTPDCLTIYFASNRVSPTRMFRAQRASITAPWPAPTRVDDFADLGGGQEDPWISSDQRTFAFASDASGTKDLYLSTR